MCHSARLLPSIFFLLAVVLPTASVHAQGQDHAPDQVFLNSAGGTKPSGVQGDTASDLFLGLYSTSLDLALPVARAGFFSGLALHYRSRGGGSAAGVGWELSTISIERLTGAAAIQATYLVNRDGRSVPLDATQTQLEFRERFDNPLTRYLHVQTTGDDHWEIVQTDGSRTLLGKSDASRLRPADPQAEPLTWFADAEEDTSDNLVCYQYSSVDAYFYLAKIAYNPSVNGVHGMQRCQNTTSFGVQIQIDWEPRPDETVSYQRGVRQKLNKRLAAVTALADGSEFAVFRFRYDADPSTNGEQVSASTGRSLLAEITRERNLGGVQQSISISQFEYSASAPAWETQQWPGNVRWNPRLALVGDFDGNGTDDFAVVGIDGQPWDWDNNHPRWEMGLSTGSGWKLNSGDWQKWQPGMPGLYTICIFQGCGAYGFYSMPVPWSAVVTDLDGDNRSDIAYSYPDVRTDWIAYRSRGDHWASPDYEFWPDGPPAEYTDRPWSQYDRFSLTDSCRTGDFNGDHKQDVACIDEQSGVLRVGFSQGTSWRTVSWPGITASGDPVVWARDCFAGDLDGDGTTDILCRQSAGSPNWLVARGPNGVTETWQLDLNPSESAQNCVAGRFNDDGLIDLACMVSGAGRRWSIQLSTGKQFADDGPRHEMFGPASFDPTKCAAVDMNGDGLSDLVCDSGTTGGLDVSLLQGARFTDWQRWQLQPPQGQTFHDHFCLFGDFTGDGALDIACAPTVPHVYSIGTLAAPFTDSLVKIRNLDGQTTTLKYSTTSMFADNTVPRALKVLRERIVDPVSSPALTTKYSYTGGRMDATGQFIGFKHVVQTDNGPTPVFTSTEYDLGVVDGGSSDALVGKPRRTERGVANGLALAATDLDYVILQPQKPYLTTLKSVKGTEITYPCGSASCPIVRTLNEEVFKADALGRPALMHDHRDATDPADDLFISREFWSDAGGEPLKLVKHEVRWGVCAAACSPLDPYHAAAEADLRATFSVSAPLRPISETAFGYDGTGCDEHAAPSSTRRLTARVEQDGNGDRVASDCVAYDDYGNVTKRTGLTGTVNIEYDAARLSPMAYRDTQQHTFATIEHFAANEPTGVFGELKSIADANGARRSYKYDFLGRLTEFLRPDGSSRSFAYTQTGGGLKMMVSDSAAGQTELGFDGTGRLIGLKHSEPFGRTSEIAWRYYADGRLMEEGEPIFSGGVFKPAVHVEYDWLGRTVKHTSAAGDRTVCYFADSFVLGDEARRFTRERRDSTGRIRAVDTLGFAALDPNCSTTTTPISTIATDYDTSGNVVGFDDTQALHGQLSQTIAGTVTSATERSLGASVRTDRVLSYTRHTPEGDWEKVALDRHGNPLSRRLSSYWFGLFAETAFRYDEKSAANGAGRLTSVEGPAGKLRFDYDAAGRLTRERRRIGLLSGWKTLETAYDGAGRVSGLTFPDRRTAAYVYESGRLTAVQFDGREVSTLRDMDASGRPLARTLGNGLVETRTYDGVGRLTRLELTNSSTTIMHWWTWQYDAAGNLSERRDSAGRWWRGTYDNLDRLLSEETPSSQRTYTYDRAGRRNNDSSFGTISYGSATGVHDQAPTRLARALVVYDANGNVIAGNGRAIGNDAMGFPRRVSYVRRGLHWTSIAPDGLGRIGKTRPLFGRSVVWWGDRALCRGTRCTDRVFDTFGIAFEADRERRWFHVDQGGTPLAWSDAKGGVHVIELSSGGALTTGDRSDAIPLFHGQRQIGSTGLYLFGERLYDPELGLFLSADSSVAVGAPAESWNRYLFARGNPARFEDPDGRQPSDFSWSSSTYSWSMNYSWYQNYSFDVAVYSAQLREFNARRFDVFTQNPQKFLVELKQQPMSIGTIPSLRSAIDYMPHGSVFAPLPEGESFAKNIAILQGDPAEFTGRLTDLFASVVAPGRTLVKFATLSKSGSTWDYKSRVRNYLTIDRLLAENAGNFAYGVHGASIGLSLEALLQAAGAVQVISNGTRSQYLKGLATGEYGFPGLIPPYGDDAIDQYWIMRGYYYYHQSYRQMQQAPVFP